MILDSSFFSWIWRLLAEYSSQILLGMLRTILLACVGTIVGFLLALVFSAIKVKQVNTKTSKIKKVIIFILKQIVQIYVSVIRGTPMMVQALIFYYLFKGMGINWDPLTAGLFTVSINTTAYLTEVLRGGIESVDKGQLEAARSIGMSNSKAMIYVVYPQAIKISMASIGNEFIVNIKDTSVLSVIGVIELYNATSMAGNKYFKVVEAMVIAASIYLILTLTSSFLLKKMEGRIGSPVKEIASCN